MSEVLSNTIQVQNVKMRRVRSPMLAFDLVIAMPNPANPERPYAIVIKECCAKPLKKYVTPANPDGWRWFGPQKYLNRMEQYSVHTLSDALHDGVLGILQKGGYLQTAKNWSTDWFDARWRFPDREGDPASGIHQ
jgi:hypothetical protein